MGERGKLDKLTKNPNLKKNVGEGGKRGSEFLDKLKKNLGGGGGVGAGGKSIFIQIGKGSKSEKKLGEG